MACPLCGAHPGDAGCEDVTDQDILNYSDSIVELYNRLRELQTECPDKACCAAAGNDGHQNCTPDPELLRAARRKV